MNYSKILFVSLLLSVIVSCKKDDNDTIDDTSTLQTNLYEWKQSEIDSIMAGDTSQAMRVYLTTNYADSLVLRAQSINVIPDSTNEALMTVIRRMYKAMSETGGVGIAAPQVGINRNIIWVKRMDKTGGPFEVYLNPKILMTTEKTVTFSGDGCLSIPNTHGNTKRYAAIGIEYDKLDGNHYMEVIEGYNSLNFTAVCFQHEIDHLNGILFIDRIP